jgi:hypothetical protein
VSTALAVPHPIERGLRGLRNIAACTVDEGARFDEQAKSWVVRVTLRRDAAGEFVGTSTRWCVLLDIDYPFGRVSFYPAAEGGLSATFPHQLRNTHSRERRSWRGGKLCLDTPFAKKRAPVVRDPVGDADGRIQWHAERALEWLDRAANSQLAAEGDPFELPDRPHTTLREWNRQRVVHDETATSLAAWTEREGSFGLVQFGSIADIDSALAVRRFEDRHGAVVRAWTGRELGDPVHGRVLGFWWLWPKPIVLRPWQAPGTWGDLRRIAKTMGIDVDPMLRWLFPTMRAASTSSILMLGYPMPLRIGEGVSEVHWDALILPRLPAAAGQPPRGFRPNSLGWWHRDRYGSFGDNTPLEFLFTENWSSERLQARGRLPKDVRDLRVVVLGLGALGSTLAEMLVRAGVTDIAMVDDEKLVAGNVCRHIATLADVGKFKVHVVGTRLRQISPAVRVTEVTEKLHGLPNAIVEELDQYDAIVDCTSSDEVLDLLASAWWSIPRMFASFSMGRGGRRVFSFGVSGHYFPHEEFAKRVRPWLDYEVHAWDNNDEVLEGAGCWSPLFPARHDDVVLAAAICVKELEALIAKKPVAPRFRVFTQSTSDDGFQGFFEETAPPVVKVKAS